MLLPKAKERNSYHSKKQPKEILIPNSVLVKNLILQDATQQTISLPMEIFEKIHIHWLGG